jgi:hypothetical protein
MIQFFLGVLRPILDAFKHSRDAARRKLVLLSFIAAAFFTLLFGILTSPPPTDREVLFLLIHFVGLTVYLFDVTLTKLWRCVLDINATWLATRRPVTDLYEV